MPTWITQVPRIEVTNALIQMWAGSPGGCWRRQTQLPVCYILLNKSLAAPAVCGEDSRLRHCELGITFTEFISDSREECKFLTKWH